MWVFSATKMQFPSPPLDIRLLPLLSVEHFQPCWTPEAKEWAGQAGVMTFPYQFYHAQGALLALK